MSEIRELDPQTVERIAAGEVVERPASVVKELVENSLDADADRVEVAVESGGKESIRVTDDGRGMTESEVRRAVEKHTTSKITDVADLEGGIATLGFRGEALHAIGAVSRLSVTTRPNPDRDDVDAPSGTELTVEGGEVTDVEPAGCPAGTTVEVTDLFYNVPARRKYLKQESTEFAHVNTVVTSYALANPDVAVSLTHDGRETFATTGGGDLQAAVMAVYGREVAEAMIEVDARVDGDHGDDDVRSLPDGPLDGVRGLVSHPETTRASREYLSTYVNGRYVTANTVRDAVVEAYDTQLAPDRYPFAVLFLDLPAGDVDVNVHPRKLDVRFADEAGVSDQIRTAVESALLDAGLLRSSAPRGKSAPEQATIDPESTTDSDGGSGDDPDSDGGSGDDPDSDAEDEPSDLETVDRTATDASSRSNRGPNTTVDPQSTETAASPGSDDSLPRHESDDATADSESDDAGGRTTDSEQGSAPNPDAGESTDETDQSAPPAQDRRDRHRRGGSDTQRVRGGHEQARLSDDGVETGTETTEFESLPSMRLLGQYDGTYVVAETDDGLVLIDQHAADERVNYERLRERFAGETTTQALADPVELSLTAREAELFAAHEEALASLGFRAERVDDRSVVVRTVPSLVADAADPELLRDVLGAFVTGDDEPAATVEAAADELLADLACYPSVTGNVSLAEGSIRELLGALDECDNPWACPHGRPVVVEFDRDEIESRFERDYPGHHVN